MKYWTEIRKPEKYAGKESFFGTVTDPYNPEEEQYRRTRSLLEQLQGSGVKITIQTKSDLVLRDMDLPRSFLSLRVGFSINTLDEKFQADMDKAVSIGRRLDAMKAPHDSGIRTTCFISPIFPGITDVKAIVERGKGQCNLIWLENLNLRGSYKPANLGYIQRECPEFVPLYQDIYNKGERTYWERLDAEWKAYAAKTGLDYVTNDDGMEHPFGSPLVIVNCFYHEQVKKSPRKVGGSHT